MFQISIALKEFFISIKDFIISINWMVVLDITKTIFVFFSILFLIGIVYVMIEINIFSKIRRTLRIIIKARHFPKKIEKKWQKIDNKLKSDQESNLKLAVIEADKFFDNIFKNIGYMGKDMGGRLEKITSSQISNIDDIWSAHKIRNKIVHDMDYKLIPVDAQRAVKAFEQALKELEVL